MSTIQPQGEEIRKAAKWLVEERAYDPEKPLSALIEEAAIKFDLTPKEVAFLQRFIQQEQP
jgi:hypothetical protein